MVVVSVSAKEEAWALSSMVKKGSGNLQAMAHLKPHSPTVAN